MAAAAGHAPVHNNLFLLITISNILRTFTHCLGIEFNLCGFNSRSLEANTDRKLADCKGAVNTPLLAVECLIADVREFGYGVKGRIQKMRQQESHAWDDIGALGPVPRSPYCSITLRNVHHGNSPFYFHNKLSCKPVCLPAWDRKIVSSVILTFRLTPLTFLSRFQEMGNSEIYELIHALISVPKSNCSPCRN